MYCWGLKHTVTRCWHGCAISCGCALRLCGSAAICLARSFANCFAMCAALTFDGERRGALRWPLPAAAGTSGATYSAGLIAPLIHRQRIRSVWRKMPCQPAISYGCHYVVVRGVGTLPLLRDAGVTSTTPHACLAPFACVPYSHVLTQYYPAFTGVNAIYRPAATTTPCAATGARTPRALHVFLYGSCPFAFCMYTPTYRTSPLWDTCSYGFLPATFAFLPAAHYFFAT